MLRIKLLHEAVPIFFEKTYRAVSLSKQPATLDLGSYMSPVGTAKFLDIRNKRNIVGI